MEDSSFEGWTATLPEGHRLETSAVPRDWFATIRTLHRADESAVKILRKRIPEVPEDQLTLVGRDWEHDGAAYEVVTSFVDLFDPKASGVTCFAIRDNCILPLRPKGWNAEVASVEFGSVGAEQVS